MPERVVAAVPRVVLKGSKVLDEYGILLTDARSIFVYGSRERVGDPLPRGAILAGALLGGAAGAAMAAAMAKAPDRPAPPPPPIDFGGSPDALAEGRHNFVIPHNAVTRIELAKRFGEYVLTVGYNGPKGKPAVLETSLMPPSGWFDHGRAAGKVSVEVSRDYARYVQAAFQAALPSNLAQAARWDI